MQLSKTIQIPVPPVLEYIGLGPEPRVPNGSLCMCKRELSAEEADRPCSDFGDSRLLIELNKGRPSDKQLTLRNGVREAIQFLITYNHDFGVASAFFRLIDSNTFPSGQLEQFFIQHQKELNFQRVPGNGRIIQDEGGQDVIVDPYDVKPRRIWDLYSNRVIPFRWFELLSIAGDSQQEATVVHAPSINLGVIGEITRSCSRGLGVVSRATSMTRDRIQDITSNQQRYPTWEELSDMGNLTVASLMSLGIRRSPTTALPTMPYPDFWAISHSWVKLCSRQYISSTVNQHQWKIPIPLGVTIEDIRQDLRSHDAEYCWLDILCLRQKLEASDPDALAKNEVADMEHQIDVPTIGNVYKQAVKVLYYFNGLRQPLRTTGLDDTRHWLNRAWTLQEIVEPQYSFTMEDVTGEVRNYGIPSVCRRSYI